MKGSCIKDEERIFTKAGSDTARGNRTKKHVLEKKREKARKEKPSRQTLKIIAAK